VVGGQGKGGERRGGAGLCALLLGTFTEESEAEGVTSIVRWSMHTVVSGTWGMKRRTRALGQWS